MYFTYDKNENINNRIRAINSKLSHVKWASSSLNEDDFTSSIYSDVVDNGANSDSVFRILHVVTSLVEQRLFDVLVPTLKLTVDSIIKNNWSVDVYLVLGYEFEASTRQTMIKTIKNCLPDGVGLEIWEKATPMATASTGKLETIQTALARQHRFVVKDKIDYYDFFSCWEDDMRITAEHIKAYLSMSRELDRLKKAAVSSSYPEKK